jgi:hypothetical protein
VYFEAAAVITVLVLLGQLLELRARERTSGAIRGLLGLQPKLARRIGAGGEEEEVAVEAIAVEVERIGEAQRFSARLLEERLPEPSKNALPPGSASNSGRVITPH